jgi:hypothetical protein
VVSSSIGGNEMYKVTNKWNDERKFRDGFLGKDVIVEPGKSVFTNRPPEENDIWKVEIIEETPKAEEKKKKLKEEDR